MSADSYDALVETAMRKMKYLYDFSDFESAVASHGALVVDMEVDDFFKIKSGVSSAKFTKKPTLAKVQEVQFRKGTTAIFW